MNRKLDSSDIRGELPAQKGTLEWADRNYNICIGCQHGCLYCYAKSMRNRWDSTIRAPGSWERQHLNPKITKFGTEIREATRVMFPSSHDIVPEFLPQAVLTIGNLLKKFEVLVVSKPHLSVIERLCQEFSEQKERLLFRFTIGSIDQQLLSFWEPHAPQASERIKALRHAKEQGFRTSVSIEPMIGDVDSTLQLVSAVEPFVTETIWIGKMNRIPQRLNSHVSGFDEACQRVRSQQSDVEILRLVNGLQNHPKVRWKDSIREVIATSKVNGSRSN